MNKKTKMWLGVGVVAVAAYYFWNKSKKETTNFASANGPGCRYTLGRSTSGKHPMVFEICPGKPPRIAREVQSY